MKQMAKLGHLSGFLHTQTPSYLACKIYLDLGWEPFRFIQSNTDFKEGWSIVDEKIKLNPDLLSWLNDIEEKYTDAIKELATK